MSPARQPSCPSTQAAQPWPGEIYKSENIQSILHLKDPLPQEWHRKDALEGHSCCRMERSRSMSESGWFSAELTPTKVRHSDAIYGQRLRFCNQSMREKAWRSRKRGASGATRLRQARRSSACTFSDTHPRVMVKNKKTTTITSSICASCRFTAYVPVPPGT